MVYCQGCSGNFLFMGTHTWQALSHPCSIMGDVGKRDMLLEFGFYTTIFNAQSSRASREYIE